MYNAPPEQIATGIPLTPLNMGLAIIVMLIVALIILKKTFDKDD